MNTAGTMKLEQTKQCVEARDADMSGSKFTDVNLNGAAFKASVLRRLRSAFLKWRVDR